MSHRSIDKDVVQVIIRDGVTDYAQLVKQIRARATLPIDEEAALAIEQLDADAACERAEKESLRGQLTDLQIANGLLQNQVKDLRGDLNIERLHRDAKLCSQCPRAPEFKRLQIENAELRHSLAMNWPYSGA